MDIFNVLETFGVPITMCVAFGFFIWKQNKFIQNDLTKDIHNKFNRLEEIVNVDLRNIIIALINQQKKMQIELRGIKAKYESLVDIILKLMKKEKEDV